MYYVKYDIQFNSSFFKQIDGYTKGGYYLLLLVTFMWIKWRSFL